MADQTRHAAITALAFYIGDNVAQLSGNVTDGPILIGSLGEDQFPHLYIIEGPDEIDDRITVGRDIIIELGLFWVYKPSAEDNSELVGRTIEDALVKQIYLANVTQLPPEGGGDPTILWIEAMNAKYPFLWPEVTKNLKSRGRVVKIRFRQET